MTVTPNPQDSTRSGWERTVTPKPAAGPSPYLAGAIAAYHDELPAPGRMLEPLYRRGYHDGRRARLEQEARVAAGACRCGASSPTEWDARWLEYVCRGCAAERWG